MPNVSDLSNSNYVKKEDCEPPVQVTIAGYEQVNVAMDNQPKDMKWILKFSQENIKPLVLNQVNGQLIAQIVQDVYGVHNMSGDFDNWIGKNIELYNDKTVMFQGKLVGGVRVRPCSGQAAARPPIEDPRDFSNGNPDEDIPY